MKPRAQMRWDMNVFLVSGGEGVGVWRGKGSRGLSLDFSGTTSKGLAQVMGMQFAEDVEEVGEFGVRGLWLCLYLYFRGVCEAF